MIPAGVGVATAEEPVLGADPARYLAVHATLDEGACETLLTPRERDVRDAARRVVAEQVAPTAHLADSNHVFVHESYQSLATAGLAGLLVPEEYGGSGDSHVAYALAMEEITAGCAATSLVYMTQMHAAYPLLRAGSQQLVRRHVLALAEGSAYGSLGVTEPSAGSDAAALRTQAARQPDGSYRITGSKTFITTGDRFDLMICFATVDPAEGHRGITAFLVTGDSPGLTRGTPFLKMGMHGSTTAEVFLDGVPVPEEHRLGAEGEGWALLTSSVVKSRVSAAAQGVGLARGAYASALVAAHEIHGGTVPADVAGRLAGMRGRLLRARLLLLSVARQVDLDRADDGAVSLMKQGCTDIGWEVAVEATRVLGRYGDLARYGAERYLRDAKVTQIYDGTNEVQRLLVARETTRRTEGITR